MELLDYLVEQGSPLAKRNPAGYLRRAIEEDYQPPKGFKTRVEREAERRERAEECKRLMQQEPGSRCGIADKVAQAMEEYGTTEEVRRVWEQAQGELQLMMTNATYMTYLHNAMLLCLEDGVAILGVQDQYVGEWLQERLAGPVCRVLEGIVGKPVSLKAVVV